MHGPELARRRRAEAQASAASIGATYEVFDQPDGELDDRLEYRYQAIRLLREFAETLPGKLLPPPVQKKMGELIQSKKVKAEGTDLHGLLRAAHKQALRYPSVQRAIDEYEDGAGL